MKKILKKGTILFLVVMLAMVMIPMETSKKNRVKASTSTELVWGQSYSGDLYGTEEYCDYTFRLPASGRVSLLFTISSNDSMGTGLDEINFYDISNKKICTVSAKEGISTVTADLLAGEYRLEIIAGFWTGCKFSFTPSFTDSQETQSESYNCTNNETSLATSYPMGTRYTGQFAQNDSIDIYEMKVKKTGFVTFDINSQIQKMTLTITSPFGYHTNKLSNIQVGTTKETFFMPKGTYYFSFENEYGYDRRSFFSGNYTFKVTSAAVPSVQLKKVKNVRLCSLDVTWGRNVNVDGYVIQIATNSKFTKN